MKSMVWRWHDFCPEPGRKSKTCGVDYQEDWAKWKVHPAHGRRLIDLIEEIHAIPDEPVGVDKTVRDQIIAKKVRDIVWPHGPR